MSVTKADEEVIDFLAAGTTPDNVVSFQPSEETKARARYLIEQEKPAGLTPEEKSELDHYRQIEDIMRLAKAHARRYLAHE